jgi:hypothetical protein
MGSIGSQELVLIVLVLVVIILPFWKIFKKAGFSPLLSLLLFVPGINILLIFYLAFADWPSLKQAQKKES